jgi:hypothetical protein
MERTRVGALVGGWAVEGTRSVALVYGVIGILGRRSRARLLLGPLGHADHYLPAGPGHTDTP